MRSIKTTLGGDLDIIAAKAMEKDKGRRYQSARDLADDVRRFLNNEPIRARYPSAVYQMRKFARRNRILFVGAACFGVAMTIGFIGMAWFAIGKSQALEAESRRFEEVRKLANVFINEMDGRIRELPGATDARRFVVSTGLEYLDSLEKDSGDDSSLQFELAVAYFRMGDIQGYPDGANLGDAEGAWESYQKGLALLDKVAAVRPDDISVERALGNAYSPLWRRPEGIAAIRRGKRIPRQVIRLDSSRLGESAR